MEKLFDVPIKQKTMYLRGNTDSLLSTDTYFGCFPCDAYAENTSIETVRACVKVSGKGMVELHHADANGERILSSVEFDCPDSTVISIPSGVPSEGYLYLKISGSFEVSDIWYEGEGTEKNIRIAIIICTFRREEYLLKNLEKLSRTIESDLDLRTCIDIFCVDNGGTLSKVPAGVTLIQNRNYGGSGGYARGMLEARKSGRYTHFWMMDDDIRFEPVILRRAVTFMQHRRQEDIRLAAGMLSFEAPSMQVEATAVFNGYTFTSNASGLDFQTRDSLLKIKIDANDYTYGGWWSFIMPATEDLPMPFFIKMDDIEYGIRNGGKYVIMNGFGVWHEAFGKKGSAWPEYYTTRNTLIVQNMYPELPHSALKMMGIRLLKALAFGEPKCMEAAFRGVQDYLAGAAAFRRVNPEERHMKLLSDLKAPVVSGMTRKKMLKAALKNMRKPGSWRSVGLFLKSVRMLRKQQADGGWKELCTEEFWREYLGLE